MIGGRSLMDEVNHVKMVVSFFVLLCACLMFVLYEDVSMNEI